jgi:DNA helicase-2/ATP-dependent DNA helicase PcrA
MQDYSYIQYLIIRYLFNCKMTIVGDRAQTMEDEQSDVMKFLPEIFGRDIKRISLNKSYRQTVEIARYAQSLIGEEGVELLERHGRAPEIHSEVGLEAALEQILDNYVKSRDSYDTFAVLTMSQADSIEIYSRLKKLFQEKGIDESKYLSYLDRDSKEFKKGMVVTTFYLAKGLEFDKVYSVYEGNLAKSLHMQARYIMATRALHELYVYELEEKN